MDILILIVIGLIAGLIVNFIAEWFYLRRKFFPKVLELQYEDIGILRFILTPWLWKERPFSHKFRVITTYIILALAAVWMWGRADSLIIFAAKFIVITYFALVIVMDVEARVVLHPVSIFGAIIGIAYGWYSWGLVPSLFGGAFGFCSMFLIYWLGKKMSQLASKKRGEEIDEEPMGFGDVNLSGVLGLMLGWPGIVAGLFIGILAGGAFSLIFIVQKLLNKKFEMFQTMPYAPFLVIGAAVIILLY